jgi:hypothetical protein
VGGNRTAPNAKYVLHLVLQHFFFFLIASTENPECFSRLKHSIFNDRLGTYTVSIHIPYSHFDSNVALPHIRVHLYNPTGALKFSASLRAKYVVPFRTSPYSQHSRLTHSSSPTYSSSSSRPAFPGRRLLNLYKWLERCCVGHLLRLY